MQLKMKWWTFHWVNTVQMLPKVMALLIPLSNSPEMKSEKKKNNNKTKQMRNKIELDVKVRNVCTNFSIFINVKFS